MLQFLSFSFDEIGNWKFSDLKHKMELAKLDFVIQMWKLESWSCKLEYRIPRKLSRQDATASVSETVN